MIALTPELDRSGGDPLYRQLYDYIKRHIEAGTLREEERLPSIRQLSAHLQVSKNTVETAYQQLLAEGYVRSRDRSGLVVLPLEQLGAAPVAPERRDTRASEDGGPAAAEAQGRDDIRFEYGDVEIERFPFGTWRKCLADTMLQAHAAEVLGYGDRQGDRGLREEIARHLYASRGVLCDPEQVFLAAGTQQTVSLLCQLLPLPRRIAMEEPGYNGVRAVLRNHGRELVPVPLDPDGLSVDALQACGADAVYVTPSHQFPIGTVMPVQRRVRLLQWAYAQGGYIVEDDYDSEFRYIGQPIPALKAMDTGDRVIYLGTFSKSFLPAVRLSYVVLPERLAAGYRSGLQAYGQSVSPLLQGAVRRFMQDGHFERHVRRMRKLYQTRHRTLLREIEERLGNRVGVIGQRSGLHLLLDVHGREADALIERAGRLGVQVYSPRIHWSDPADCPASYVMLGFGGLDEARIREGVRRLEAAWFGDGG